MCVCVHACVRARACVCVCVCVLLGGGGEGGRADLTQPSTADAKAVKMPAGSAWWGMVFHSVMTEGKKEEWRQGSLSGGETACQAAR